MADAKSTEPTAEDLAQITEGILKGNLTIQQMKGITDEEMDSIYAAGHSYYNHGKYQEASDIFEILAQHNQYEHRYWMGLGACRQMMKKYGLAVDAYGYAQLTSGTDPRPAYYAAQCLLALEENDHALAALEGVLAICEEHKEYEDYQKKAKALYDNLKKK